MGYTAKDALMALKSRGLWACLEERLHDLTAFFVSRNLPGISLDAADVRAFQALAGGGVSSVARQEKIAIIPLHGVLTQHPSIFSELFGGSTYKGTARSILAAAADRSVSSIVLHVDSPGGEVYGAEELSAMIAEVRRHKPIVAVADSFMASAAYWAAVSASEVVGTTSAIVGAIGVFQVHIDLTEAYAREGIKVEIISAGRYKGEGIAGTALTDEARAAKQSEADGFYDLFVNAVARGRDVTPRAVREGYGEGRALLALEAKRARMIDRIATFEDMVSTIATRRGPSAEMLRRRLDLDSFPGHS